MTEALEFTKDLLEALNLAVDLLAPKDVLVPIIQAIIRNSKKIVAILDQKSDVNEEGVFDSNKEV